MIQRPYESGQWCHMWRMSKYASVPNLGQIGQKGIFTYLGPGRATGPGCPQEGGSGGPMSPGSGAICGECQDDAVYQIWAKSDKKSFLPTWDLVEPLDLGASRRGDPEAQRVQAVVPYVENVKMWQCTKFGPNRTKSIFYLLWTWKHQIHWTWVPPG